MKTVKSIALVMALALSASVGTMFAENDGRDSKGQSRQGDSKGKSKRHAHNEHHEKGHHAGKKHAKHEKVQKPKRERNHKKAKMVAPATDSSFMNSSRMNFSGFSD